MATAPRGLSGSTGKRSDRSSLPALRPAQGSLRQCRDTTFDLNAQAAIAKLPADILEPARWDSADLHQGWGTGCRSRAGSRFNCLQAGRRGSSEPRKWGKSWLALHHLAEAIPGLLHR